jgi:hypothetical protein
MTEPLKAIATGVLKIGEMEIPCAVLNDEKNTRVLTQDGFLVAIGRSKRPNSPSEVLDRKPAFLRAYNLKPFIDKNLRCSPEPIHFRSLRGGGDKEGLALGYEADLLPEVCWVYHDALINGKLKPNQTHIAAHCEILLRGLTNVAITALVDEATGYQETRDKRALQKILDAYLRKELAAWAKRFPNEFYDEMFRLRGWNWSSMKRPSFVGKLTNDIVYERIAPGLLDELGKRNPKDEKGNRKGKHHQLFTDDVGDPALAQHLYAVITLMKASSTWDGFYRLVQRSLPKKNETIPLPFDD